MVSAKVFSALLLLGKFCFDVNFCFGLFSVVKLALFISIDLVFST